jgi:hypothetical protein
MVCFKGDTSTGFVVEGLAETHAAVLSALGFTIGQAMSVTAHIYTEAFGCDPGKVPEGRFGLIYRLCKDCAAQKGLELGIITGDNVPVYRLPG